MWINKTLFDTILADNERTAELLQTVLTGNNALSARNLEMKTQKAKDDIMLDWFRHRINALEQERAVLLRKQGIHVAVPEIVPTRPGTMTVPPSFDHMPSFEDVGDEEATRMGIAHDPDGLIAFTK